MDRAANPERDRAIAKGQERGHDPATPEVEGHRLKGNTPGPDEGARAPEVAGHGSRLGAVATPEEAGASGDGEPEVAGHISRPIRQ